MMMKISVAVLFLIVIFGCDDRVNPQEKATITGYILGITGCAGGYIIKMESGEIYDTYVVPAPFNDEKKFPRKIWIGYDRVIQTGMCSGFTRQIDIKSIRKR